MRKKFEIVTAEPLYQPPNRPLPLFTTVASLDSNYENRASQSHRLYLTEEAMSHIIGHIGWGSMTQHNCIEQGGILVGQAFRDDQQGIVYAVAHAAVAGLSARGSSVHLEMTHDTWREMLESVDVLLEQSPQQDLQVIGWYHTHPNGLQVFMSSVDQDTQSRLFVHDWQFAIVLNPQKRRWRSFFGADARECLGYVIAGEESETAIEVPAAAVVAEPEGNDADEPAMPSLAQPHPYARVRARLTAWVNSQPRLLRACLIMLCLVLLLQCLIVAMLTRASVLGR